MDPPLFWNEPEAHRLLAEKIEELRGLGYDELKRRCGTVKHELFGGRFRILAGGSPHERIQVTGPSGVLYFMEIDIEDAFEPEIEVSVLLGEVYGHSPEIGDSFSLSPPAG